jgi:SH3 domain-containing YSC84-like protein 1
MFLRLAMCAMLTGVGLSLLPAVAAADPEQTVRNADQVLHEVMVIPGRAIPQSLLVEAQGIAIIPDVIKVGFVAGIRRGHGVVMVRDSEGEWSLPQFVVLTGGSVGWQAGIQGTDVVLVFMTKRSVDGLLRGKFTIGADASAAAGPLGRDAAAATDARLKAEILSYSRSRGLFLGLSLDGSAIEIDPDAQIGYYGSAPLQVPRQIPASATQLRQDLVQVTPGNKASVPTPAAGTPTQMTSLRESLARHAQLLYGIVDPTWQKYLALPREVFEGNAPPRLDALQTALSQYERVVQDSKYESLTQNPEFQSVLELLREYIWQQTQTVQPRVLPPPPAQ